MCVHVYIYFKILFFYTSVVACQVGQFGFVFHVSCAGITRITQNDALFCHA